MSVSPMRLTVFELNNIIYTTLCKRNWYLIYTTLFTKNS